MHVSFELKPALQTNLSLSVMHTIIMIVMVLSYNYLIIMLYLMLKSPPPPQVFLLFERGLRVRLQGLDNKTPVFTGGHIFRIPSLFLEVHRLLASSLA